MKYEIHENGWTVIIKDFDLRLATQEDINFIAQLISKQTLVIFKKQNLSVDDEVRIAKMFKEPFSFDPNDPERVGYRDSIVPNSEGYLIRVTGAKDDQGREGFSGMEEALEWHCNDSTRSSRKSIVWLYGIKGTAGSRTSWNNNILSYNDLSPEWKERIVNIKSRMKHFRDNDENQPGEEYWTPNIVHTGLAGITGLFFSFLQIHGLIGVGKEEEKEIMEYLTKHTMQEKYMYHLDWEDGDLSIADQWFGIHKRWRFAGMKERLLHRIVFDYPDQNYGK